MSDESTSLKHKNQSDLIESGSDASVINDQVEYSFVYNKTYITFIFYYIWFFIIILIMLFAEGKIIKNSYPNSNYKGQEAFRHYKYFAEQPRFVGSPHYQSVVNYISTTINTVKTNFRDLPFEIHINLTNGFAYAKALDVFPQYQGAIQNTLISLIPKNDKRNLKPLTLSAHIDGHIVGPSAYDDAVHCCVILDLVRHFAETKADLPVPVQIFLLGSEEMGRHGSTLAMNQGAYLGSVINLESIGTRRIMGSMMRGKLDTSVLKAISKASGTIIATYSQNIFDLGLISSKTDFSVYQAYGIDGAELSFFGNPAQYHSRYDVCTSSDDLTYEGNILSKVILNFEHYDEETTTIGLGISPLAVCMNLTTSLVISIIFGILSLACVVLKWFGLPKLSFEFDKQQAIDTMKALLFHLLFGLVGLVISVILSLLNYAANPTSFGRSKYGFLIFFAFFNLASYNLIKSLFKRKIPFKCYLNAHVIFDSFFLLIFSNSDVAPMLSFPIIIFDILLFIPFRHIILDGVIVTLALVPRFFVYILCYWTLFGYSPLLSGIIGDLIVPLVCWMLFFFTNLACQFLAERIKTQLKFEFYIYVGILVLFIIISMSLPVPYSTDYPLRGKVAHIFYPDNTSVLSFVTDAGARTIRHLHKLFPNYERNDEYELFNLKNPALVQTFSDSPYPDFLIERPEVAITESDQPDGSRNVTFEIGDLNPEPSFIGVFIKCPSETKCVRSYPGHPEGELADCLGLEKRCLRFKGSPASDLRRFEITLEKGSPNVTIDYLLNYNSHTKDIKEFLSSAPDYVVNTYKSVSLQDTIIVYSDSY